jgi:hypothetical protein
MSRSRVSSITDLISIYSLMPLSLKLQIVMLDHFVYLSSTIKD